MQYIYKYNSPIGEITMASGGESLIGLWFKDQKYFADTLSGEYIEKMLPVFKQTISWLDLYFKGEALSFTPPLLLKGSQFRIDVWNILLKIPYGSVVTYGDIADEIKNKCGLKNMSAQAVGGAVGHNPISIIVPCHRVVGSSGSLTGYAGGIDKKIKLLQIEKINISSLKM